MSTRSMLTKKKKKTKRNGVDFVIPQWQVVNIFMFIYFTSSRMANGRRLKTTRATVVMVVAKLNSNNVTFNKEKEPQRKKNTFKTN